MILFSFFIYQVPTMGEQTREEIWKYMGPIFGIFGCLKWAEKTSFSCKKFFFAEKIQLFLYELLIPPKGSKVTKKVFGSLIMGLQQPIFPILAYLGGPKIESAIASPIGLRSPNLICTFSYLHNGN